jgi:hypothetical protein
MNNPCLDFEFNEAWVLADEPDPATDTDLMRSTATKPGKVRHFTERWPGGKLKARWSGSVADDGRFLLEGKEQWFYADGKSHYEASYNLGRKIDMETLWRADGSIEWQRQHAPDGTTLWTQFWENGTKKSESTWRDSHADGPARRWDREGKLISEVRFANGVMQ